MLLSFGYASASEITSQKSVKSLSASGGPLTMISDDRSSPVSRSKVSNKLMMPASRRRTGPCAFLIFSGRPLNVPRDAVLPLFHVAPLLHSNQPAAAETDKLTPTRDTTALPASRNWRRLRSTCAYVLAKPSGNAGRLRFGAFRGYDDLPRRGNAAAMALSRARAPRLLPDVLGTVWELSLTNPTTPGDMSTPT